MSCQIKSSLHHSFDVDIAQKYGLEEAIIIHHFQFWIRQNAAMGRNFQQGRTWMYQTQKEIAAIYPYFNEDSVQRILKRLIEKEVLISDNFNKNQFDKTKWYAFKDEKMFTIPQNRGIDKQEVRDPTPGSAGYIRTDPNTDAKPVVVDARKNALCKDDIHSLNFKLRKGWSSEEIEDAWNRYESSKSDVDDIVKYIEGIIKKIRLTKDNEKQKEPKPCQKATNTSPISKKPSSNANLYYAAGATSESPLAIFARQNGLR